ncbi:hypothetical protein RUM44_013575 [Polyplax serrata]|uniref:Lebercilin domain-containing protein n=1 Tax=Polyplax serrata TaxID=468196 RepID=A0ABR1BEW1_POLSC
MTSRGDSSGLSVISEEKASARRHHDASGDYESGSLQKMKSAYGGTKKKHPLMQGPGRQSSGKIISLHSASKNNLSEFTQRIMSAKLLRVKQVQNQLNETQLQLNELINENRILRNMQKRQEGALKRYEGNHAELPQLIRSHNEEIRTLKASNKQIKVQLRESNTKLKEREAELETLRDNYTKLKKLSTEKNLLDREKLQKKVDDLQEVIKEQEEKIQVLSRKILLESKNYRHQMNVEMLKHKETQKDLSSALTMINKLESQLLAKDRAVPGSKILLKRESKTVMPMIANKSIEMQSKMSISDDGFLSREDGRRKSQTSGSPDSELELLNMGGSSEETPSPTQDIFPDILKTKKSTLNLERTTERCFSKSELYSELDVDISNIRRQTPGPKKSSLKSSKLPPDLEASAKIIAEKLSENMESIDELAQKVEKHSLSDENKSRLSFLLDDVNENAAKLESELLNKSNNSDIQKENFEETGCKSADRKVLVGRRNVPKRKFEDNLKTKGLDDVDIQEELTGAEQQKLESMTKTWNELKGKIKEERKKAEEKVKELAHLNGKSKGLSESGSSDSEDEKREPEDLKGDSLGSDLTSLVKEGKKELRFVNFTDDSYILQELEKTDKVFNKLKNETKKSLPKGHAAGTSDKKSSKSQIQTPKEPPKPKQPDIKSFRTESRRDSKFLEEFQSEYQKQNLIKALKAIDNEKDPSYSTEDSGDSESETQKKSNFGVKNGLKSLQKVQQKKPKSIFSTADNLKFDWGTVTGVND